MPSILVCDEIQFVNNYSYAFEFLSCTLEIGRAKQSYTLMFEISQSLFLEISLFEKSTSIKKTEGLVESP